MNIVVTNKHIELEYPCLMISKASNTIVLFTEDCCGTVLNENIDYSVGFKSSTWEMDSFEMFNGTLELSN